MSMLHKDGKSKDLDSWINLRVKILLNADGFYQGTLIEEMKNGILISANKKHIYIPFESIHPIPCFYPSLLLSFNSSRLKILS